MARVLIVGAGTGGLAGAYEIRQLLDASHQVTVINERADFQFVPSNPWVAVGQRQRSQISFPIRPHLERKNIALIEDRVTGVDPSSNTVQLASGATEGYDHLVIATGPKLNFAAVEGSGPGDGFTQSVCTLDHAEACYRDVQKLLADPGPVIVGALPGASCFGPAYEYALILERELRRHRVRDRVPMYYVTPEPYVGHMGLAGVGDSRLMLESELRSRHIQWLVNARVSRVADGTLFVDELDDAGALKQQHELPFRHSMLLPSFVGVEALQGVEGLVNEQGMVLIDEYQRNPTFQNIHAAGVCVAIPPVEQTPVPVGAPKTGYMIESMMTAIAHNLAAELDGRGEPNHRGSWSAVCLADLGDTGAAFIAVPQNPPRNITWYKQGRWVRWAKKGFEKYFLQKVRLGYPEPFFERFVMKQLGIERLKDD